MLAFKYSVNDTKQSSTLNLNTQVQLLLLHAKKLVQLNNV